MPKTQLLETGGTTQKYYKSINNTYLDVYKKYLMLHYPFFRAPNETLEERQINLTDHCISRVGEIEGKNILEVGCGNGTQSLYILHNHKPKYLTGIDINKDNIEAAKSQNGHANVSFFVDDAQKLENIPDNSVDVLICIESAFHYPDKQKFLEQIERVLTSDGKFLIADILSKSKKNRYFFEKWKRKMSFHHTTADHYSDLFKNSNLQVEHEENLTPSIKQGYKGYNKWIQRKSFKNFFKYLWFKLFLFVQVNLNILLLRTRRNYVLFIGKPRQ